MSAEFIRRPEKSSEPQKNKIYRLYTRTLKLHVSSLQAYCIIDLSPHLKTTSERLHLQHTLVKRSTRYVQ
jgi:hypothetical protein